MPLRKYYRELYVYKQLDRSFLLYVRGSVEFRTVESLFAYGVEDNPF